MLDIFKKYIKIGKIKLFLDLTKPHEKNYYSSIKNNDFYLAQKLINKGYKVLDLGANIGFTSLLYLSFGAREVYAFEPVKELFDRLKKLKTTDIKAYNLAISNFEGETNIFLSTTHNQGHSLNNLWPQQFKEVFINDKSQKVRVTTLDNLLINDNFDFIKIDVEGAEKDVIEGGDIFFRRNKNAIIQIEIYNQQFFETDKLLKKYYNFTYIPIFEFEDVVFKNINDFEDNELIEFKGPPNYIYSNREL
ncbi:MAG: FkbM family methyltransferase [Flavobacteriales bacterium]|nr:FkbM family methyltransferase [Flavobacteriales bacterium]